MAGTSLDLIDFARLTPEAVAEACERAGALLLEAIDSSS